MASGVSRTSGLTFAGRSRGLGLVALLAGLAILACSRQLVAQFAMPDPREMAGIPRPVGDLPDGAISVRLIRGQLSNNIPNHPVELQVGSDVRRGKTDENGRAQFNAVPPGSRVRAVAVVDRERLESQEFQAPPKGGIRLMLVATPKPTAGAVEAPPAAPVAGTVILGGQTRIIMEPVEEAVQIYYLLAISNTARVPVQPSRPLTLDLPTGARAAGILEGASAQATVQGSHLILTGPFQPGETMVQLGYELPYSGDTLEFTQQWPATLEGLFIAARKVGGTRLSSPQISESREVTTEGDTIIMAAGPAIAAGGSMSVALSGLPHSSATPRRVALGLALLVVLVGVLGSSRRASEPAATRRRQLQARREQLFGELVRVEERRRAGAIEASRYAARRRNLVTQLERVYGELDGQGRGPRGDTGLAA